MLLRRARAACGTLGADQLWGQVIHQHSRGELMNRGGTLVGRERKERGSRRERVRAPAVLQRLARGLAGRGGRRGRHRWELYAVPVLAVLTVLVVVEYSAPGGSEGDGSAGAAPSRPVVTEPAHVHHFRKNVFAAALPPGEPFPLRGAGTFHVLPGASPPVGQGHLYRYTVETENGLRLAEGNDTFGTLVQQTLSSPRSWTNPKAGGIALQRVDAQGPQPDFRVTLVSRDTARRACGYDEGLPFETSCRSGHRIYVNVARWERGAVAFQGDMGLYRQYLINHEVGHFFGNHHAPCPEPGALAPVMMQQTLSTANNDLAQLNEQADQGGASVPRDGAVCRPNAWPFPLGNQGP